MHNNGNFNASNVLQYDFCAVLCLDAVLTSLFFFVCIYIEVYGFMNMQQIDLVKMGHSRINNTKGMEITLKELILTQTKFLECFIINYSHV